MNSMNKVPPLEAPKKNTVQLNSARNDYNPKDLIKKNTIKKQALDPVNVKKGTDLDPVKIPKAKMKNFNNYVANDNFKRLYEYLDNKEFNFHHSNSLIQKDEKLKKGIKETLKNVNKITNGSCWSKAFPDRKMTEDKTWSEKYDSRGNTRYSIQYNLY